MKAISPVLVNQPHTQQLEIAIAKDQPEYMTLPSLMVNTAQQQYVDSLQKADYIITRFEITDDELAKLIETKSLFFYQYTLPGPQGRKFIAPVILDVHAPGETVRTRCSACGQVFEQGVKNTNDFCDVDIILDTGGPAEKCPGTVEYYRGTNGASLHHD